MFHKNDRVKVKREIIRFNDPRKTSEWDSSAIGPYSPIPHVYAKEGETGTVLETFRTWTGDWHAKVLINGKIRTFRLTSLEKIG